MTSGEKEGGTDSVTRSDSTPTTSYCDSENKKATITSLHKKQFHWVLSTELYEISLKQMNEGNNLPLASPCCLLQNKFG